MNTGVSLHIEPLVSTDSLSGDDDRQPHQRWLYKGLGGATKCDTVAGVSSKTRTIKTHARRTNRLWPDAWLVMLSGRLAQLAALEPNRGGSASGGRLKTSSSDHSGARFPRGNKRPPVIIRTRRRNGSDQPGPTNTSVPQTTRAEGRRKRADDLSDAAEETGSGEERDTAAAIQRLSLSCTRGGTK